MYEYTYPGTRVVETTTNNGWGPLVASIVGGVVGYVVGRNNNGCGNGILGGNNGCGNSNSCCDWLIWILLISCFCGGNNNGCC